MKSYAGQRIMMRLLADPRGFNITDLLVNTNIDMYTAKF
jgi:hypothetical protein